MRILHITRYFQPNMGYQENGLLAAQMRLGHTVQLITSDRYHPHPNFRETMKMSDDQRRVGAGRREEDGLDVVRLPVVWELPAHWWVLWGGLWKAVAEFQPDIIHTHCAVIASSTFQILWGNLFRRYPIVVDDHNNYFNIEPYTWPKWALYHGFKWFGRPWLMSSVGRVLAISHEVQEWNRRVSRFIALSEFAKSRFVRGGFAADRISVKPNFVEDPRSAGVPPEPRANGGAPRALFVGRLTEEKGIRTLLRAWRELPFELGIAGEGPLGGEVRSAGLKNMALLGKLSRPEVARRMREADFLVVPSESYENFPLVLAEAFASGLPVVARPPQIGGCGGGGRALSCSS